MVYLKIQEPGPTLEQAWSGGLDVGSFIPMEPSQSPPNPNLTQGLFVDGCECCDGTFCLV